MDNLLNIYMWSLRLLGFCIGAVWGHRLKSEPIFLFWTGLTLSAFGFLVHYFVPSFPHSLTEASASPDFPYLRDALWRVVVAAGGYMLGIWAITAVGWCSRLIARKRIHNVH